jgi:hypothetical protein
MKYRKDFVTNSSSSSYVCEICGRTERGYDVALSEIEMQQCVNGHTICTDEALDLPDKSELVRMVMELGYNREYKVADGEYQWVEITEEEVAAKDEDELWCDFITEGGFWEVPECVCPICQFIEYSDDDLSKYLELEYKVSRDEVFDEIKKNNRRRRKLYESEYIAEVCPLFDLMPHEVIAEWKERFGSYAELQDYLRGVTKEAME